MADRLERLVNLTATLLDTRRPLTLDEVAERVAPRYPDDRASRHRQFERDKETLRELGIGSAWRASTRSAAPRSGTASVPSDYYLPDLELSDEEREAAPRRRHRGAPRRRRRRRGRRSSSSAGSPVRRAAAVADLPASPVLGELFDADGATRRRAVLDIAARNATSSRTAWCCGSGTGTSSATTATAMRRGAFRTDRIEGAVAVGQPGEFSAPPDDFDPEQLPP